MSDGTRAHATGDDWLEPSCSSGLRALVADSVANGRALVILASAWASAAGELVSRVEPGLAGQGLPDDLFEGLARLIGVQDLLDAARGIAEAGEAVATRDPF